MQLTADHIAAITPLLPDSATDIEVEMAAVFYACLPDTIADRDALSMLLLSALREHFSGSQIYIPKAGERTCDRNKKIYAAFNGRNYLALARQYGLTERHVRAIVESCYAHDIASRQSSLF